MENFEECDAILRETNNIRFLSHRNRIGHLKMLPNGCFLFETFRNWLQSSTVEKICYEDNKMIFKTIEQ